MTRASRLDTLAQAVERAAFRALSPDCGLTVEEAVSLLPFGTSRLYQLIGEGKFPAPRDIGGRRGWLRSEVLEWMRERPRVEGYRQGGRKRGRR